MPSKKQKLLILCVIAVLCVSFDQSSKIIALNNINPNAIIRILGGSIRLQLAGNHGAFLSLGASLSETARFWIFIMAVSLALISMIFYYFFSNNLSLMPSFALSLVISGGLSNLIDRIIYQGMVIDFLNIGIGPIRTGIFNLADFAITSGTFMLVYFYLTKNQSRPNFSE